MDYMNFFFKKEMIFLCPEFEFSRKNYLSY